MKFNPSKSTALAIRTSLITLLAWNSTLLAQSNSTIPPTSGSASSSSLGTTTPSATKEAPAKKPVENTTNGGNDKPVSVEPIKKLSDYTIDELFTDRSLSPSRKPMGRFSPDGKHLLSVTTQKDPAGDYWTVIKTPIVLPPSPIDPQKNNNSSTKSKQSASEKVAIDNQNTGTITPANPQASNTKPNNPVTVTPAQPDGTVIFDSREYKKIFDEKFPGKNLQGDFSLSDDGNFMLVTYDAQQIYRHSSSTMGYVVDLQKKTITFIPVRMRYPMLSPNNKYLSYVADNNIFLLNLGNSQITQVTFDGKNNSIINGAVDWVYEEEFTMDKGMAWSPSGDYLAYYRFDETAVKEFSMDAFSNNDIYPNQVRWKYPKAGEDNSKVSVWIYSVNANASDSKNNNSWTANSGNESPFQKGITTANSQARQVITTASDDSYLPRIQWADQSDLLFIQKLNRWQNHWQVYSVDANAGNSTSASLIVEEKDAAYVEIPDRFIFVPNTKNLIYTSEKSGYNHLYLFNYEKKAAVAITRGDWEVVSLLAYVPQTKSVLFTATKENILEDHLYSVDLAGKSIKLLTQPGYNYSIQVGPNSQYYYETRSAMAHLSPNGAIQGNWPIKYNGYAFELRLKSLTTNQEKLIYQNDNWNNKLISVGAQPVEFKQFNCSAEGTAFTGLPVNLPLNSYVIYPNNFDPSKKYPVLMHIYGGPGSNQVKNTFMGRNFLWHQFLASKGYMVVVVDNRGTGRRGAQFKKSTYLQLGKLEALDHAAVAKQLGRLPYVDSARIGIWGWSFGGYMSSLAITKSPDVFKMAIAVAPVTSWRYYDNIYTERFLRRPQDNPTGYDENSPINFTKGIKGNYLLIHGSGDDNVHWQNSAMMINSMIESGSRYNFEIYPNRNHGIGDPAASKHLYNLMTNYILNNL
jgi:dipeptidyl-peptidase-4